MGAFMTRSLRALTTLPALTAALLLAGCGGVEAQLRDGLISAGLSQDMAGCMAKPMAHDLNMNQLLKLRSLARVSRMDVRKTSYAEFTRQVRALNDPVILRVTTAAGLSCAFGI
jgi:hypothetical protein